MMLAGLLEGVQQQGIGTFMGYLGAGIGGAITVGGVSWSILHGMSKMLVTSTLDTIKGHGEDINKLKNRVTAVEIGLEDVRCPLPNCPMAFHGHSRSGDGD